MTTTLQLNIQDNINLLSPYNPTGFTAKQSTVHIHHNGNMQHAPQSTLN